MARQESDREDLLREATAYVRRLELQGDGREELLFAGFREDDRFSIYFGADPVYHFDSEGRLRRAYLDGLLYRTQGDTLARLRRVRTASLTQLVRSDLSAEECAAVVDDMRERLRRVADEVQTSRLLVRRQVPEGLDLLPELLAKLAQILNQSAPLAPAIAGRE